MIELLGNWITSQIALVGYPAVFILMTLESALIPIPSEVTMPFAGFLVAQGKLDFWLVIFIGAFGNLVGSLAAYFLGYWGQEKFVKGLIKSYGKFFLISIDEVETAERWFRKRGELIAFGSRLLPVIRTFISLPAGFSQMDVKKFSAYTFAGALIWTAVLTYLGVLLGNNWTILGYYFHKFDLVIVVAGLGAAAAYVFLKIRKIKKTGD